MNDVVTLTLSAFGVFYAAVAVALMDGPFDLFARLRGRLGQKTWIGRGVHCPVCLSAWMAILPAALLSDSLKSFPFIWLGLAGAATLMYRIGWGR